MAVKSRKTKTSKGMRRSSKKNPQTPLALILMGKGAYRALSPIGGPSRAKK